MLRHQSPDFDIHSFLSGPSEMARRIRAFDWADHPLGPVETWSTALRSALGIALNSAFPTCIYWGSQLRLLYNDAWSTIPGPRHPACLGEPAEEVWSDIWHVIGPQFGEVIKNGEGLFVRDQLLPMRRYGVEEETYWNYSFTPIRVEDGSIGGIFNSGSETTRLVLQQRQTEFLLELSDVFRQVRDPAQVRSVPLEMLGRHLGADRLGLRERMPVDADDFLPVVDQWTAAGVPALPSDVASDELAETVWGELLDGHIIKLDGTDPARSAQEARVLEALGCASAVAVPCVQAGETVAILFAHSLRPRRWTETELHTLEAVLDRMMGWLERNRAAERERVMAREIDHRARNLLTVVQSIARLSPAEEPEVMRAKLIDRITALAKTHTLLSGRRWEPVPLRQIAEQELAPYAGVEAIQIELSGPSIVLTPDHSQAIALVLHELTTNAVKYGVFRDGGGHLALRWSRQGEWLRLEWIETCRDAVKLPEGGREGFGSRLLNLVVELQLEGGLRREYTDTGLRCEIDLPLKELRSEGVPAARG